jgi:hypothetical protein
LPLKGVVEFFGDGEEIRAAVEDAPPRIDSDVVHERDEGVEYLCHTASLIRGIDVEDVFAVEGARFSVDGGNDVIPYDFSIIF